MMHNDPWVVQLCMSSWRQRQATVVFAHRQSQPMGQLLVWSGCAHLCSMRQALEAEAGPDAQRDLHWMRALRWRKVGEGEGRTCADPQNSLSQKDELCTSHNS